MNVAHVNPAWGGGAGEAARRLHEGLRRRGVSSTFFNFERSDADAGTVRIETAASPLDKLASRWRGFLIERERAEIRRRLDPAFDGFGDDRSGLMPDLADRLAGYDLVHIHGATFLVDFARTLPRLAARGQRVVWTLHDMNVFTGGCHYDRDCGGFARGCGRCPALRSDGAGDLSRTIFRRKAQGLRRLDPARTRIVSPSRWLADEARRSPLLAGLDIEVIPNGLDLDPDRFGPGDRAEARRRLGLPEEAAVVLGVASSLAVERKGFAFLDRAMAQIGDVPHLLLATVGAGGSDGPRCRAFGPVSDPARLRDLYVAADLLAVPSLQDNLPNTVLEAMGCGLPVVAFAAGGIPEMVREGATGFTVPVGDAAALAERIGTVLRDGGLRARLGAEARRVFEAEYGSALQAERYFKVYESLLTERLAPSS